MPNAVCLGAYSHVAAERARFSINVMHRMEIFSTVEKAPI